MIRSPAVAALLVVAACGFHIEGGIRDPDRDAPGGELGDPDAAIDDAIDGATDGPITMIDAPPQGPTLIPGLATTTEDDDPSATADLLELYFNSSRSGGIGATDIWFTTRPTRTSPWAAPQLVANINTASNEGPPEISPDGLTLMFSSDRGGGAGGHDIYVATRPNRSTAFSNVTRISMLSSAQGEYAPFVQTGALRVVLTSSRNGTTGDDLWIATRVTSTDPWGNANLVTELSTSVKDANAWLSQDGLTIVFSSDRPGSTGEDLWRATRASMSLPFGTPVRLATLSSTGIDTDPWISPDGTTIFFASDRASSGDLDIYEASAP